MFEGLFPPMHLLVIFGIALLVFGPKKLPELGKGIGEGIRGSKAAMNPRRKKSWPAPPTWLAAIRAAVWETRDWGRKLGRETYLD